MSKINEIKVKVKETATEVKDFVVDNKGLIASCAFSSVLIIGGIVYGRKVDKKYETAWRKAKELYESGQLDGDFGPYKVAKFFEPKTGELIGQTMMHVDSVNAFSSLK